MEGAETEMGGAAKMHITWMFNHWQHFRPGGGRAWLKGRLQAAGGATAVAEQTLDEQIFEIMGQLPLDPNQAPWMQDGNSKVDLQLCTPV
eukprot:872859-Rhodomonas_salina.4